MSKKYPRDMIGYGSKEPKVVWPNNAKLALQIVLNYEEGGENNILHGDKHSETFLSEIIGAQAFKDRHINMESMYEYGSRRGFWRVHELFQEKKIPITIFGVGMALEKNRKCIIDKRCVYKSSNLEMIFEDCYKCPEVSGLKDELEMDHNHILRKDTRSLKVKTVSINDLLEEHNAPKDIDYISIDTEGSEFSILSELNLNKYSIDQIFWI